MHEAVSCAGLDQLDHGGAKYTQIIKARRNDLVDLHIVNLPVDMDQQISEARHLLKAACAEGGLKDPWE
jgi:hypothetical protein